ncbi:MAG: MFS transporter [Roseburia sp.]|nr:MFS transporter [Roseburia sp.]
MKKNETKLLLSRAVNKIGNVMYDYGNSTWIAAMGAVGQKYLGYYQLAENIISLILNPIGGAVADRFKRRKILLVTDFVGGLMCALLALIGNDNIMLYGLIAVNAVLAMLHAFSGTSFKSYVVTLVEEDRLVTFNSRLEMISQVVSISSPLLAFLYVDRFGLKPTLVLDSVTFFISFLLLFSIREEEQHIVINAKKTDIRSILEDIKEGLIFVVKEKEVFFLLVIASLVNFFISAFNYLAPFSNQLFDNSSSYATLLSMGAVGSILAAFFADKLFKNSYNSILISLALCGVGLIMISLFAMMRVPAMVIVSGNLVFEFFLTIFNIHFFSMVQKKVPNHMLGRVFSSIFSVAVILMPLSTAIMTVLPFSINIYTFAVIGCGILAVSGYGFFYSKHKF